MFGHVFYWDKTTPSIHVEGILVPQIDFKKNTKIQNVYGEFLMML